MRTTLPVTVIHRRAPRGGLERYRGGQFISNALWDTEKAKARSAMPVLITAFADRFQFLRAVYAQQAALQLEARTQVKLVPLGTVATQMKTAVREVYTQAFLYGKRAAGNLTSATDRELEAVKKIRLDEFTYLNRYLEHMKNGEGVMDYTTRADYYVQACRELFWLGYVLGDLSPGRSLVWKLGPTEHCASCLRFADHGPYPVADFVRVVLEQGYLPQSGKLDCLGYHCQCRLEEE